MARGTTATWWASPAGRSSSRTFSVLARRARRGLGCLRPGPLQVEVSMPSEIADALADLEEDKVLELVKQDLAAGTPADEILAACQEGMVKVGERFERAEYFVSDLMMAGEIFKEVGEVIGPSLTAGGVGTGGKVVVGTVKGDIHDIGKDIVVNLSLIHISEPTRQAEISYAVF